MSKKVILILTIILFVSGVLFGFFFPKYYFYSLLFNKPIDFNIWGQFGSVMGGILGPIFSLMGALLIALTLYIQKDFFVRNRIDSNFFQFLNIHKQNVNEIRSLKLCKDDVFIVFFNEFFNIYNMVAGSYRTAKQDLSKHKNEIIGIAYIIFFYGYTPKDKTNIKNWIKRIIGEDELPNFLKVMLAGMKTELMGHQSWLSHYYRNLFQAVKYINEIDKNTLSFEDKYTYVKMLRAQLSNYEQALLFFNSISPLGAAWELGVKKTEFNNKMITKYNMIKNIPPNMLEDIEPSNFYGLVHFEHEGSKNKERIELEKKYT